GVPNLNGVAFTYSDCATGVWVTGDSGEPVSYAVASHEFTFRNYDTGSTTTTSGGTSSGGGSIGTASTQGGATSGGGPFEGETTTEGDTTTTTTADTTTYTSTYAGIAIADNATTESTLDVSDTGTVSSMTVGLTIQHNWDEDLDLYLVSPSGTSVELSIGNGSRGDHYTSTVFSDSAITLITAASAPFTGTYQPEGSLSDFNSENINGTWTLRITDDTPQNAGILVSWYISITTPNPKGYLADAQMTVNHMSGSCSVATSDSSGSDSDTEVDIVLTYPDCTDETYSNQSLSKPTAGNKGYSERYLGKAIWDTAVAFIEKSGGSPVYDILSTKEIISLYANNITKWTSSYIGSGTTSETTSSITMVGDDVEKNSHNLVYWLRGITSGITGGNSSSLIKQSVRFTTSEQAEFDSQTSAISFN
ncbi:MAG: proprotein convertase P-domain-containing protein, partial [Nitrospinota bacterium]